MRILVKWPTRSRPRQFSRCLKTWISKLSGLHDVTFLVNQDVDDRARFEVYRKFLRIPGIRSCYQPSPRCRVEFIEGACKTKIEAINFGMVGREFDILLSAADDMWPEVQGYDDLIVRIMEHHFPTLDGALNFWDGSCQTNGLCTLSLMGVNLYRRFGYIYHPAYLSLFADDEFTEVCQALGCMVTPPGWGQGEACLIRHRHPVYRWGGVLNYDALMRRNESPDLRAQDRRTFQERKACNFDLG